MTEEFIGSVKEIEREAEALLEQARAEARKILEDARKQADEILSKSLPMDEIHKEQEQILQTARMQAETMIEDARKRAAVHRQQASSRLDEVVGMMLTQLRGNSTSG
ncbi:MAG TPA: hypothetical protein PK972_14670 [Deltaproteobacteria bacterium]|nr:hypothetical protein [Deltaproteobacteria bacterium]HPL87484.1 hypothetical protein [Deltaproteobacteria bacterium]